MPMSPRLLRPIASRSLVDADATAYLAAVEAADGQALEPAVRNAITAFVLGCKQDGIWSAIKASCILCGARTLSGALTPLAGSAPGNTNFVSGDYDRKTGLLGNGASKSIDTGRANSADGQNNQHLSVYISSASSQACAYIGASTFGTAGTSAIGRDQSFVNCRSRHVGSLGGTSTLDASTTTGLVGISRAASSQYSFRAAGTTSTISIASDTPTLVNILVFVTNQGTGFSNGRCAFYSIGEALTLSALDSRISTLYTAIGAAIP
jgi:hypothetical protein